MVLFWFFFMAVFLVSSFMVVIVIVGIEKKIRLPTVEPEAVVWIRALRKARNLRFVNPYLLVKVTGNYLCSK